jgi:PAS domain S-box
MNPQGLKDQNRLILNASREGICILDLEGKTTFVNLAAAEMVGWNLEELTGSYIHDILHPPQPDGSCPRNGCKVYATKDWGIHRVDEEVFWRKDGTNFPVEYTSTPIVEDEKLTGVVLIFTNITERKRAKKTEEALRQKP